MSSRRIDIYLRTARTFGRVVRLAKGVLDGFWLGVLGDAQLDAVDAHYYGKQPEYLDAGYTGSGLRPFEERAVDQYFGNCRTVVVTGAGGGREVLALLRRGIDAVGYECNAAFVAHGRDLLAGEGHPDRIRTCSRDLWPPAAGPCDGVVVGWGSYMLIRSRSRRVAFLRAARSQLPDGAPIMLSFFARTSDSMYLRSVRAVGTPLRRLRRHPPLELGDALAPNFVHYFDRNEISRELEAAGFELVHYGTTDYGVAVGIAAPATHRRRDDRQARRTDQAA